METLETNYKLTEDNLRYKKAALENSYQ